jgi:flotillin
MFDIAVPATIGVALIVVLGIVFTILYKRATRDEAFVRTGLGGKKVVLDGGAMILPIFHSYASVNLKTLRLTVERKERESLITKDRLRVDIVAEFYVRVRPDDESIALASQTLGALTNDAEALRNQVEAKFVDGLRSVAATMTILELQEKRSDFVKHVQATVESDVKSNGLELESVSLTKLDQTDVKFFNPENFFDAEGLTQLKTVTETRRRDRNSIVRDNEVAIAQKDLEARQQTLTIERTKKEAELSQERDIANKTASPPDRGERPHRHRPRGRGEGGRRQAGQGNRGHRVGSGDQQAQDRRAARDPDRHAGERDPDRRQEQADLGGRGRGQDCRSCCRLRGGKGRYRPRR